MINNNDMRLDIFCLSMSCLSIGASIALMALSTDRAIVFGAAGTASCSIGIAYMAMLNIENNIAPNNQIDEVQRRELQMRRFV